MGGKNLQEGKYLEGKVSDGELWEAITGLFSHGSKNTSYQFVFLKSILDNLENADSELVLTFDQLFSTFSQIYWELVVKYGLNQIVSAYNNRESRIAQIFHSVMMEYGLDRYISYNMLPPAMASDILQEVKEKCSRYVVGVMYADTNRLFYSFCKKEEWIRLNPQMFSFVMGHRDLIEELNYLEWARFLEKVNESTLSSQYNPDLQSGYAKYRNILYEEFEKEHRAVYSESDLSGTDASFSTAAERKKKKSIRQRLSVSEQRIRNWDEISFGLLDSPAELVDLLQKTDPEQNLKEERRSVQRRWRMEEMLVLAAVYYTVKDWGAEEQKVLYHRTGDFLRMREEKITGLPEQETFVSDQEIEAEIERIRCLDTGTGIFETKETEPEGRILEMYRRDPESVMKEAGEIYRQYAYGKE